MCMAEPEGGVVTMTDDGRIKRERLLLIANPAAGTAHGGRLERIVDRLRQQGCSVHVRTTGARGEAERITATTDPHDVDAILVAGGDGTINEVVNGMTKDGPPLAILPFGTVNVLASEIGMPRSDDAVADTAVFGPCRRIAIGEANGRRFAVVASVGLDAEVVEHVDLALKRKIGRWAYVYETFRRTITSPPAVYRLRANDLEQEVRGIVIANGRHYAGRYITSPKADLEKPSLDICRLTRPGRLAALSYLMSLTLGRFAGRSDVRIDDVTDLEILGPAGAPLQADGDILCRLPATIRVLPDAVQLIYPITVPPSKV